MRGGVVVCGVCHAWWRGGVCCVSSLFFPDFLSLTKATLNNKRDNNNSKNVTKKVRDEKQRSVDLEEKLKDLQVSPLVH